MPEDTITLNVISSITQIISSILKRCTLPAREKTKLLFHMKCINSHTHVITTLLLRSGIPTPFTQIYYIRDILYLSVKLNCFPTV